MFVKLAILCVPIIIGLIYHYCDNPDAAFNVKINPSYDYIIVGSGSAGAVIANRLTEDENVTVLLVEAGGSDLENYFMRVPAASTSLQDTDADWMYKTVPQNKSLKALHEQTGFLPRGRVLGGTSTINYSKWARGSRHDFDQWEKEGCTGWSFKDVLPYFLKIENIQIPELMNSDYHYKGGYVPITKTKITKLPEVFERAAKEIGYKTVDPNGEDMLGFSYIQSNIRNGEKWSTSKAYIRPIVTRPNLHISLNSLVTKVLIKDKTAYGIEMVKKNRKHTVLANKEVILSAGVINTPQILMLSGIGPKKHLEDLNIEVISDLPGVGQNLQDHLNLIIRYKTNVTFGVRVGDIKSITNVLKYLIAGKGLLSFTGSEAELYETTSKRDPNKPMYPDYRCSFFSVAYDKEFFDAGTTRSYKPFVKEMLTERATGMEYTIAAMVLHPESKGSIQLKSTDPFDHPLIDPNFLSKQQDIKVMIEGIRKIQELSKSTALRAFGATLNRQDCENICDKVEFDSDKYWECIIRHYSLATFSPSSSCRMGSINDPTAVVDPELRVKGISNLRVADSSVFRDATSGSVQPPTVMIGEKASDLIRGKDTVQHLRNQIKHLKF